MSFLVAWLTVVTVLSLMLLVALFGALPQFQHTPIARLRSRAIEVADRFNLDDRTKKFYERYEKSLRWAVPIGYVCLVSFLLYLFYRDCYGRVVSEFERTYVVPVVSILPYIVTPVAVFSDPGYITAANHRQEIERFPYDNILFVPGNECSTCKRVKPARSKHCSSCDYCVAMCDHHCVWLNNCIGYYNVRWFLAFVSTNVVLLVYGCYVHANILHTVVSENFPKGTGWFVKRWGRAIVSSPENRTAGMLMLLCGSLSMVATAFLCEHLKYIYQGVTTNETLKWEDVHHCMQDGTLYVYDSPNLEVRKAHHANNEPSIVLQRIENDAPGGYPYNRDLSQEERRKIESQQLQLRQIDSWADINNIYDRGFWTNLRQRLFPQKL